MNRTTGFRRAALAAALLFGGSFWSACYHDSDRENARSAPPAQPSSDTRSAPDATSPAAEAAPQGTPASTTAQESGPGGGSLPLAPSHGPIIPLGAPGGEHGSASAGGGPAALPPGHPAVAGGAVAGAPQWVVPRGWQETTPSSAMRRAQYRLPASAGDTEDGECVVFYFGAGQGGDATSNIARWTSMVTDPDGSPAPAITGEMQVGDRKIVRLRTTGTYQPAAMGMGGPPPAPKSNWMMLGAVVPGGDANWFFRCTGPRKTITTQEPAFDALLKSIR
jgi:hypothetical protein